jgi:diadenylate cyclase
VQLLISVFFPNSPLHDGAGIIRGNRIMAAGCLLPLSENLAVTKTLGTRHRAGLGVTEQTDAVAIVISEETGTVTLAREGELHRDLSEEELKAALLTLFGAKPAPSAAPWRWWRTLRRT